MSLHEFFKKYRERAKLTAKQMARLLRVSYGYYTRLERPFEEGKAVPSEDLIRRFLNHTIADEQERQRVLKEMLEARVKLILPPELYTKCVSTGVEVEDSMPREFLHRLKLDVEAIGISTFCKRASVPESFVREVIEGKRSLSRDMVIRFAKAAERPVTEYLALANYITDTLKSILGSENNIEVLTRMFDRVPPEKISQLLETIETLVSLYRKSSPEK